MKLNIKLFLFIVMLSTAIYGQAEYVNVENPVYGFLQRMESQQIIHNYYSFELPKTRKKIARYLKQVIANKNQLDKIDRKILDDYITEFELELYGTLKQSQYNPFGNNYNYLSQKEKHLYFIADSGKMNIFFTGLVNFGGIINNNVENANNYSSGQYSYGAEFRGTALNHFGFFYSGLVGSTFGDRKATLLDKKISYNFRYNYLSKVDFDRTIAGYITADFDIVKFKFGRDRFKIGYGPIKSFLSDNSETFTSLSMKIEYKSMNIFTFFGKLLGDSGLDTSYSAGNIRTVEDKFIAYNHIGFTVSDALNFGVGEFIIYGQRGIDLSYLNPFVVYKLVQNDEKDRDNANVFVDFNTKFIKGLKIYGSILLDDLEFSKIGTGYWGNQLLYNFGFYSSNLYKYLPLDFQFEYIKVDPFVFTHKKHRNTFSQDGRPLSGVLNPNSELFFTKFDYRFTYRFSVAVSFAYTIHGANPLNPDGSVKENVGGDLNLGHRIFDAKYFTFLGGDREYIRRFETMVKYEPFNNYVASLRIAYVNESLQNAIHNKRLEAFFKVKLRF